MQIEGDELYDPKVPWPAHWGGRFPGDHPSHHADIVASIMGETYVADQKKLAGGAS